MNSHLPGRKTALALALALSGALGISAPALAQQQPGGMSGTHIKPDPSKTGTGPRGTPVAPSTDPGTSAGPTSSAPSQTGVGPRGTEVGPSTEPSTSATQKK
jgi:hypothetical protein